MTWYKLFLSLSVIILVLSVPFVVAIYDECDDKSLCIGSLDNEPSVKGDGGCVDDKDCQVLFLMRNDTTGVYTIKLYSQKAAEEAILIRSSISDENKYMHKEPGYKFPDNLLYLEGANMIRDPQFSDALVMIKFSELPVPACMRSLSHCSNESAEGYGHFIPESANVEGETTTFTFRTQGPKIYFHPGVYSQLDGHNLNSELNVHPMTDLIVITVHHVVCGWKGKYPDTTADTCNLMNLIETYPFKLGRDTPRFMRAFPHPPLDLTWLWILMALAAVILILLFAYWWWQREKERKREEKEQLQDGHVAVSSGTRSVRSGVSSNFPTTIGSGSGSSKRSSMPSGMSGSGHDAHKSHQHPSSTHFSSAPSSTNSNKPTGISTAAASLAPYSKTPSSSPVRSSPAKTEAASLSHPVSSSAPKSSAKGSSSANSSSNKPSHGLSSF